MALTNADRQKRFRQKRGSPAKYSVLAFYRATRRAWLAEMLETNIEDRDRAARQGSPTDIWDAEIAALEQKIAECEAITYDDAAEHMTAVLELEFGRQWSNEQAKRSRAEGRKSAAVHRLSGHAPDQR